MVARLAILLGVPASIGWLLMRRPSWREPFRLGLLVLAPCLITLWFLHDGGLGNGLNRLGFYMATGAFFAAYAILAALAWIIQRARRKPAQGHLRALGLGGLALLAWILGAMAYENLG
jgi:uncharacterized membrane protein